MASSLGTVDATDTSGTAGAAGALDAAGTGCAVVLATRSGTADAASNTYSWMLGMLPSLGLARAPLLLFLATDRSHQQNH